MLHVTQAQGPTRDVKYIYIAQFAPVSPMSQHAHVMLNIFTLLSLLLSPLCPNTHT